MRHALLIMVVSALFSPLITYAETIHVPADQPTIQAGIDAATNGDTVLVGMGIYRENIHFNPYSITLKSVHGPASTVINGSRMGSVVTFDDLEGVDIVLDGFTITNGRAVHGGGIHCFRASPVITNNIIFDNQAIYLSPDDPRGAGIYCSFCSPTISNNHITANTTEGSQGVGYGVGLYCEESSAIITNNTITCNSWGTSYLARGSAIYTLESSVKVTNTIIWHNVGDQPEMVEWSGGLAPEVTYCNLERWYEGEGNVIDHPLFLDMVAGDIHIVSASPCRDAGTNLAPGLPGTDFEGDARIFPAGGVVDIGADEWTYAHGTPGCRIVPSGHPTIQAAIDSAFPHDTVLVLPGTYVENISFMGKVITLRSDVDGDPATHDIAPELTIIDGSSAGSTVTFENGEWSESILEGFTLTNGYKSYSQDGVGGGVYLNFGSATIRDNIITGNTAYYDGGGVACFFSFATDLHHNTIQANECQYRGGGISIKFYSSTVITDNVIIDNIAPTGGGIYCTGNGNVVRRNFIARNGSSSAGFYVSRGGGMYCYEWDISSISDNVVMGNKAYEGGGVFCQAYPVLSNMTIVNNIAYGNGEGAGIAVAPGSHAEVYNSILWNKPGDEIRVNSDLNWNLYGKLTISHCDVQGGQSSVNIEPKCTLNWGEGMIDEDPLFVDAPNDDYHLTWGSPCINRGAMLAATTPDDFDLDPRPTMGSVDMGFDEFSGEHRLAAVVFTIPETGGSVDFTLSAGAGNAGRKYFLLGSVTGTVPGFPLPGGTSELRLTWDVFTDIMWNLLNTQIFDDFWRNLDPLGYGVAQLNAPPLPPGSAGIKMYYAFCLGWPWEFVSNPIEIVIIP